MIDMRLETFLAVCETMSFTRAAEGLHITQPAVSQHMKYLETYYGCKLFSYTGKTMSLTAKGQQLKAYAQSLHGASMQAAQELRRKEGEGILLRVGATKTIGDYAVSPLVARFLTEYPKDNISLTVGNTRFLLGLLEAGELDFALIEGSFDSTKYVSRTWKRERFFGICGPSSPLVGQQLTLADLLGERLILRETGSGTREILEQLLAGENLSLAAFSVKSRVDNFAVIKDLVAKGLGISFLYAPVVARELAEGRLSCLQITGLPLTHEFACVSLKNNLLETRFAAFFAEEGM